MSLPAICEVSCSITANHQLHALTSSFGFDFYYEAYKIYKSEGFEFHNLYSSPNVIRMIKSRRMGWAVYENRRDKCQIRKKCWL
jgi:hypothetical protein